MGGRGGGGEVCYNLQGLHTLSLFEKNVFFSCPLQTTNFHIWILICQHFRKKTTAKFVAFSSTLHFQGSCSFNFAKMNDSFMSLTRTILKFCMTDFHNENVNSIRFFHNSFPTQIKTFQNFLGLRNEIRKSYIFPDSS